MIINGGAGRENSGMDANNHAQILTNEDPMLTDLS